MDVVISLINRKVCGVIRSVNWFGGAVALDGGESLLLSLLLLMSFDLEAMVNVDAAAAAPSWRGC